MINRYALGIIASLSMLAGCGGQAGGGVVPSGVPNTLPYHKTFNYTGVAQDFTVPAGVTQLKVIARGAKGAGKPIADGGRVHAIIPVTPGERLVVYVGGDASGMDGGSNGGGSGGRGEKGYRGGNGFGGGGASDVREGGDSLKDRILVAGGAGGQGGHDAGSQEYGIGGKGGGLIGGTGGDGSGSYTSGCRTGYNGCPGYGGTQKNGGSGGLGGTSFLCYGTAGGNGSLGLGGDGENTASTSYECGGGGGGGGGGYYGGGAGGEGAETETVGFGGGGGGGGSSYVERKAGNVHMWQGWKTPEPNGLVVFSWQ